MRRITAGAACAWGLALVAWGFFEGGGPGLETWAALSYALLDLGPHTLSSEISLMGFLISCWAMRCNPRTHSIRIFATAARVISCPQVLTVVLLVQEGSLELRVSSTRGRKRLLERFHRTKLSY